MTTTPASVDRDGDRCCLNCGRRLHIPAQVPGKRFCSPRCRVADWHRRNDRRAEDPNQPEQADANAVPEPRYAANAVPSASNAVPGTTAATGRCPHCGQPVAVISVLVTPAAAHVPVPTPPSGQP
jgi:endogenous inhibitor of DNA gyrase (YacG/DUF329 family)